MATMVIAVVGALLVPAAGRAASAPRVAAVPQAPSAPQAPRLPVDPQASLAELEARAGQLSELYRGELVKLDDAKRAAKRATARSRKANQRVETARTQLARLAASQYMSAGLDPALTPMLTGDPQMVLDRAVTAQHLAQSTHEKLAELVALQKRSEQALQEAKQSFDKVRSEVEKLEQQRDKVEGLIAEFAPQAPVATGNVTPRMAHVRNVLVERFGAPYTVGCYRPGSWGEHPLGRACDFMLSSGGAMPSAYQVQRGWDIANYARANASRLGIMYVIYRQQIWDVRGGSGWRMMSDRGGITSNHYDHVHVSVF